MSLSQIIDKLIDKFESWALEDEFRVTPFDVKGDKPLRDYLLKQGYEKHSCFHGIEIYKKDNIEATYNPVKDEALISYTKWR